MKATEINFLKFLKQPNQFQIPIYQRTYSWTLKQCQQLWQDLVRLSQDDEVSGHFVGSIVYIEAGLYQVASVPPLLVIDGQQRLTTISLLLSAFAKIIDESETGVEITRRKLENYYLFNNEEDGDDRFKLLLTQGDRETFIRIIEDREWPNDPAIRLKENYEYFEGQIRKGGVDLNRLYQGIGKLIIVNIALDRDRDNPQLIFESLNSTGLDLSQADLIRNYVLMGLKQKEQEKIYKNFWYPMEESFEQAGQSEQFDRFMRDYLTLKSKSGAIPNLSEVYNSFKTYLESQRHLPVGEVIADVYRYSKYYVCLAFEQETDPILRLAFRDINTLKVDVAFPFLLEVYEDYTQGLVNRDVFVQIVRLVESYVFRRLICGVPTNSMNKTFATLGREIDRDNYLESLKLAFVRKDNYRRFPDDQEFYREFVVKDVYRLRNRLYLFRKLENHKRPKELVDPENYTIEHILPQNPKLSEEWQAELGDNWKEVQAKYLHTIGNLTLTEYNPEYSDRPFAEKRDMEGGFAVSPLFLNKGLGHLERWTETEIQDRAEKLASWANEIWTYPAVSIPEEQFDVQQMLMDVFPTQDLLSAAKKLTQEVVDLIGYDRIEHILAITYRKSDRQISVNLGQWLVLAFQYRTTGVSALFALEAPEEKALEGLNVQTAESYSSRWAGDKDVRLVGITWDADLNLPESFVQAWKSAIRQAYQFFKGWTASSYMNYHQPELAQALVEETECSRHAEYLQGEMGELFEALRRRVLNLDPSVREEFKKLYIAYKTSTNFMDVVPQRSRLRLSLNMKFDEIHDPTGLCKDVSHVGRWGNGDVEVGLSSIEQLDDVMTLVQQAFSKYEDFEGSA
jgi:uncharacterized protein with ParB-like and HNH nuclease domain/predicted transport protein